MSSPVAWPTERYTVGWVVAALGMSGPRLGVMDVQRSSALPAIPARPVVPTKARISVRDVVRVLEVGVSESRVAARPVRMRWTHEMHIYGRPEFTTWS